MSSFEGELSLHTLGFPSKKAELAQLEHFMDESVEFPAAVESPVRGRPVGVSWGVERERTRCLRFISYSFRRRWRWRGGVLSIPRPVGLVPMLVDDDVSLAATRIKSSEGDLHA